jgi:hypothetical protein
MNRPNVDAYVDGMGRFVVRPAAFEGGAMSRMHIGTSFRYGYRDPDHVLYDAPSMSTPGNYVYWSSVYGTGAQETHIIPARDQRAAAAEVYIPFERFDLRGEVVYISEGRREALRDTRTQTLRTGTLQGFGAYAQVSAWPIGTPRINGNPAGPYGRVTLPKDRGTEAPFGLQLSLRAETVRLAYVSNERSGDPGAQAAQAQNIDVNAFQVATTAWVTKHVRLTAEYSLYQFPGTQGAGGAPPTNAAAAPGTRTPHPDPKADSLHEVSFRLGLAF